MIIHLNKFGIVHEVEVNIFPTFLNIFHSIGIQGHYIFFRQHFGN